MKITVEELQQIFNRLDEINSVPFEQIEWYQNGTKIEVSPDTIESWKFMGLSNSSFIRCEYYNL